MVTPETKDKFIAFRADPEIRQHLRIIAAQRTTTLTELITTALLKAYGRPSGLVEKARAQRKADPERRTKKVVKPRERASRAA